MRTMATVVALSVLALSCAQSTEAQTSQSAEAVASTPVPVVLPPPVAFPPSGNPAFDAWRSEFSQRAQAQGRSPEVIARLLSPVQVAESVITADRNQAENVTRFADYVTRRVSSTRVQGARAERVANAATFDAVEARYGVDRDVILGIWALETNFGQARMPTTAPVALATLAFEGRRRAFFEAELIALIEIVERGYAAPEELGSSTAGALGQPQFMPSVYLSTAVDWNNDGHRDIWADRAEVLASIAHYLADRGWRRDEPVLIEARVPAGFNFGLADGRYRPLSTYLAAGARLDDLTGASASPDLEARLFLPEGAGGPALMLFRNYQVIRSYNNADRYAMTIALLARAAAGEPGLRQPWAPTLELLSRSETQEMQTLLNGLGHDVGTPDGVFGENSRRGLQAFQIARGLNPADGFATRATLNAVRAAAGRPVDATAVAPIDPAADTPTRVVPPPATPLDRDGIRTLQRTLRQLGYRVGTVDGRVGPQTRAAIIAFQRSANLPQTGQPTDQVLAAAQARARRR